MESRDSTPHHGNEHTSQAQKVARQGRHKSAGKRNRIIIIDEVEYHVGAFLPIPFRGHEVACRLLQPLWGRQRPTAQSYSHTAPPACTRESPGQQFCASVEKQQKTKKPKRGKEARSYVKKRAKKALQALNNKQYLRWNTLLQGAASKAQSAKLIANTATHSHAPSTST
eukprot:scaffold12174_cov121-Isochrysis_galbana.AAC.9